ncbi:hypothetical protein K504DRAFT_534314 [Pleomassaria siparia CBS 279.74]|uniref:CorA-like transporter domain-containing protein n=1 Tax=Pleomassaria siparia CBS 279.74 TaxID=1314801 RepID=A0A6G1K761_9PLEO|nr:hypothetical protein K504DRAFT_534314 [Pleomassaria siparia CBS 279.74]
MSISEFAITPETFASQIPFTNNWSFRLKRLQVCRDAIFDPVQFHVRLIRTKEETPPVTLIKSESDLNERLLKTHADSFRVLSFCQAFSLDPLQCTESAMMSVITQWSISAMFLDILLKFGDQPQVFEESSGFRQVSQQEDGSFELCYQFMYVEPSGRQPPRDIWSFRQTGVGHKYERSVNRNTIVLLHNNDESTAQARLEKHATCQERFALAAHPLNVHLVIVSSYVVHWQDHIESLARSLQDIRKHILVIDTETSNFQAKELQTLRNIEDKIICRACRCLYSTKVLLKTLVRINDSLPASDPVFASRSASIAQQLQLIDQRLEGHINAAETLALRIQATLGLLTNMLDLQNQFNSNKISTRTLQLTHESVDDNATVRVITVCTLIYLPASFTATFFGMNFFEYQSDVGGLQTSQSFWVYIAATIPLTLITVGAWYISKMRHDKKRQKERSDEEMAK